MLRSLADITLDVRSLPSGYSKDVHGRATLEIVAPWHPRSRETASLQSSSSEAAQAMLSVAQSPRTGTQLAASGHKASSDLLPDTVFSVGAVMASLYRVTETGVKQVSDVEHHL
jgi:hypothetical protein